MILPIEQSPDKGEAIKAVESVPSFAGSIRLLCDRPKAFLHDAITPEEVTTAPLTRAQRIMYGLGFLVSASATAYREVLNVIYADSIIKIFGGSILEVAGVATGTTISVICSKKAFGKQVVVSTENQTLAD